MAQTNNIGKVSLTPRGAYNASTAYEYLDIVTFNGASYIVLQSVIGVAPPNDTYYQLIAAKGDTGANGQSPTISVGTVSSSGDSVSIENVGTNVNAVFNFNIPQGSLLVTLTYDDNESSWSTDTSAVEIYSAVQDGKSVFAYDGTYFYPLTNVYVEDSWYSASFVGLGTGYYDIYIYSFRISTEDGETLIDEPREDSLSYLIQERTYPLNVTEEYISGSSLYKLDKSGSDIYNAFYSGKSVIITLYTTSANKTVLQMCGLKRYGMDYYIYAIDPTGGTPATIVWSYSNTSADPTRPA